jgi:hypothetical protein
LKVVQYRWFRNEFCLLSCSTHPCLVFCGSAMGTSTLLRRTSWRTSNIEVWLPRKLSTLPFPHRRYLIAYCYWSIYCIWVPGKD